MSDEHEETEVAPTVERYNHSVIIRPQDTIADEYGRPSLPHRTVDILASLHKSGKISGEMRQAGNDFRNLFDIANLDPLQAADVARPMVSGRRKLSAVLNGKTEDARTEVHNAINAVGGYRSDAGNLIINVIGWGWSIKQWSRERSRTTRPVHEQEASGILQGALGVLEVHFERNLS